MIHNKQRSRRLVQAGTLLASAALVLSACGGSSSDDEGTASDLTGEPIKIGFGISETGPLSSSVQAAPAAARAWAKATNASGGINGRPVEIVIEDTKNNASAAQAAIKKLVEQDDIVALMLGDAVAEGAVGEYLQSQNIPVIGAGGYNATVWNGLSNFFPNSPNSGTVVSSLVIAAASFDAKSFAAAVCAEAGSCADDANAVYTPLTAENDITYSGYVTVASSAANYTAECLSFQKKNADFIALSVSADNALRLMDDCVQQGYEGVFSISSTSFNPSKFDEISGLRVVGTLNGFPWWAEAEPVARYRDAMEKYEGKTDYSSSSGTGVWTSLELFKKALGDDTETVTRESVFAAYHAIKDETLDGLLPSPVSYTEGQATPNLPCFWQFDYTAGEEPTSLAPKGESGNGQTGDLATACLEG